MAESIFKIKVSNGLINIELEGKSEIVIEQFNEIRRTGLENFLTGGMEKSTPSAKIEKQISDSPSLEKGKTPEETVETPAKGKRGRPRKIAEPQTEEPVDQEKRKRGRPKKTSEPETIAEAIQAEVVAPEIKEEIVENKPEPTEQAKPKKTASPAKKSAKTSKPAASPKPVKKEKADNEEVNAVAEIKPEEAKPAKTKTPKKKAIEKVTVDLKLIPTLEEVCNAKRPGPEREWIVIYALYASDFGKKTFTREDIVQKYEETDRKDISRINNLTNNIFNAAKKGWMVINPEDKKLYITAEGITMAFTIATRTAPVKEKKTGKAPKKPKVESEVIAVETEVVAPVVEIVTEPKEVVVVPENNQEVVKMAKKAKSKSTKKAKSKKRPAKKPVKKSGSTPAAKAPKETPAPSENSPEAN